MTYDPQVRAFLDKLAKANVRPTCTLTPEQLRRGLKRNTLASQEAIAQVEDKLIAGAEGQIAIRIYRPKKGETLPILLFFHGGGFVMGDLDSHDDLCRKLANGAGCLVVAVDYRLAPEHRFPAAPEDCYAALCWVAANAAHLGGDDRRIAVCGDSAGGSLATIVALMSKERAGPKLLFQLLYYPGTDLRIEAHKDDEEHNSAYFDKRTLDWFNEMYVSSEADRLNPLGSPILANDVRGLPPALIIVAQYDPLRTDGEHYAHKLRDKGVAVQVSYYEGMLHNFLTFNPPFEQAKKAIKEGVNALREAFWGASHSSG
jgi:acetyl esterase